MATSNFFIDLFSEASVKKISRYLVNVTDLYLKPIKTWKRIINYQNKSLDVFIFYFLFYGIAFYLLVKDVYKSIEILILELIHSFLPFLVLLIPFLFFRRVWKKRIKINRLFRLVFIFQIQLFPFIYLPIFLARKIDFEALYILSQNAIQVGDLLMIIALPLAITLSLRKRILWIIVNYLFLNIFLILYSYIQFSFKDIRVSFNNNVMKYPSDEFMDFRYEYYSSDFKISDAYLIIEYKDSLDRKRAITQFATLDLLDILIENGLEINNGNNNGVRNDFLSNSTTKLKENEIIISRKKLDSFRTSFNKMFFSDMKLLDSLRKNAQYKENKIYFDLTYNYLSHFHQIYTDTVFMKKIMKKDRLVTYFSIKNSKEETGFLFQLKNEDFIIKRGQLFNSFLKLESRWRKAQFVSHVLYYPLRKLGDKKSEPFEEKYKNLSKIIPR